jgi:hypothetical protein
MLVEAASSGHLVLLVAVIIVFILGATLMSWGTIYSRKRRR